MLTAMTMPALAQHNIVLDVRFASVGFDEATGQPSLKIRLSPDGAREFGDFTEEHVGETIDIVVAGDVVASPHLMSPIHSDWIIVTGSIGVTDLEAMADEINRGNESVTLRGEKQKSSH
jgi:preprotein translocase subunit SecD